MLTPGGAAGLDARRNDEGKEQTVGEKFDKHKRAGDDAFQKGDMAGAAAAYKKASEIDPRDDDVLAAYARAAGGAGSVVAAAEAADKVLGRNPTHVSALDTATSAAFAMQKWPETAGLAERWIEAGGFNLRAGQMRAQAYIELNRPFQARDAFAEVVAAQPDNAVFQAILARLHLGAFDFDAAEKAIAAAHKLGDPTPDSLFAQGRLNLFLGKMEEAAESFRGVIKAAPTYAPAYAELATVLGKDLDDPTAYFMDELAEQAEQPLEHRASLQFAMGNVLHERGRSRAAWDHFLKGNSNTRKALKAKNIGYNREAEKALVDAPLFWELPEPLEPVKGAQPIFIVGMPRSGTTLAESVLAAHDEVTGAGELTAMPEILREFLDWSAANEDAPLSGVPRRKLISARKAYRDALPKGAKYVVDKQPLNFRAIPLIRTLFPEAPIVHMRRNPVDTGFSIFRHDFNQAWAFATTLENIADFYGLYAQTAHKHLPEETLFQYEVFAENFETEAKRLIAHCGLDWQDQCLTIENSERPVATFSTTQVREGVSGTTGDALAQYDTLLSPFAGALKAAGVDPKTGAYLG
ncbi:tetratricopeptide repeat-containing sulfotransferase family protein [Hyphobacterium sp.]|uniref:tetratricopeptide repeat-containing sulfotransferase family protein n=1 Tax=Hyphobacterium sp. TaxID=2004662 RepID=UPI003BAC4B28